MDEKRINNFIQKFVIGQSSLGEARLRCVSNGTDDVKYKTFNPRDIVDVEFNDPIVKMQFKDGTETIAEVQDGDEFNKETGMMVCIMQYIFQNKTYNNMFRRWIKRDNTRNKMIEDIKLRAEETKKIHDRQAAKKKRRKEKRKAKEREEAIEIQKEAYIRALKEYSNERDITENSNFESVKEKTPTKLKIKSKKKEGFNEVG